MSGVMSGSFPVSSARLHLPPQKLQKSYHCSTVRESSPGVEEDWTDFLLQELQVLDAGRGDEGLAGNRDGRDQR